MTCGVCGQNCQKYKCPKCCLPYCSIVCWKKHNSEKCEAPVKENDIEKTEIEKKVYLFETEDTVLVEKLKLLDNDAELRQILQNPHVRSILLSIDRAVDPAAAIHAAMLEPIFVEFADRCLKVVEPFQDATS